MNKKITELLIDKEPGFENLTNKMNGIMIVNSVSATLKINQEELPKLLNIVLGKEIPDRINILILLWAIKSNHAKLAAYLMYSNSCLLNDTSNPFFIMLLGAVLETEQLTLYKKFANLENELTDIKKSKNLTNLSLKFVYDKVEQLFKKSAN